IPFPPRARSISGGGREDCGPPSRACPARAALSGARGGGKDEDSIGGAGETGGKADHVGARLARLLLGGGAGLGPGGRSRIGFRRGGGLRGLAAEKSGGGRSVRRAGRPSFAPAEIVPGDTSRRRIAEE